MLAGTAPAGCIDEPAPAAQAREAEPAIEPGNLVRARIVMDYGLADGAAAFATSAHTAGDLRRLIHDRIDPLLLNGASAIRGSDYRFTPADGLRRHAGVVTIRYASAAIAAARARPLLGDRRFLHGTKILTPMVAAARGDTVAIFFTESGGDAKLRTALLATAARYEAN
jgi:hypothetical protein